MFDDAKLEKIVKSLGYKNPEVFEKNQRISELEFLFYQEAKLLFKNFKQYRSEKFELVLKTQIGQPIIFLVDFSHEGENTARASKSKDNAGYALSVHYDILQKISELINQVATNEKIMRSIGFDDTDLYTVAKRDRVISTSEGESCSHFSHQKFVIRAIKTAFQFLLLHEFSHIFLGHVDCGKTLKFIEVVDEVKVHKIPNKTETDKISQGIEMHADLWAMIQILNPRYDVDRLASVALGLLTPLIIFRQIFELREHPISENTNEHPALWFRGNQIMERLKLKENKINSKWYLLVYSLCQWHPIFGEYIGPILQNDQYHSYLKQKAALTEKIRAVAEEIKASAPSIVEV